MSKHPFFSIIIPTYNSYDKLLRSIRSVENQTYENFEIIVVDDGSTDGTKTKIEKEHFKKLRYLYKSNGGPASARNFGIREARGEYVCFLDADDEFMPQKLSFFYESCKKGELFICSDALYINEINNTSWLFSNKVSKKHKFCFNTLLRYNFIVTSTTCLKKTLFEEISYFEESRKMFVEDYDLWLKIAKKHSIKYIDKPLSKYYIHQSNTSKNVSKTIDSLIIVFLKWSFCSPIALKQFLKYSIVRFLYIFGIKK